MDTQELLKRETRVNIEAWCRRSAQSLYLGDRVLCRVLGKYLMYTLPQDRSMMPHLAFDGYWEIWITMAIAKYIKPGMTCVDVGANVGYYSVLMADWVGLAGTVVAIEPEENNQRCLLMNLENGAAALRMVHGVAASDRDGSKCLTIYSNHSADHGFRDTPDTEEHKTRSGEQVTSRVVFTRTLDSLLDGRVDFIKLDVEGHERAVWLGMPQLLERNPQVQIAAEWMPQHDPQCELGAMALAAGFELNEVHTDGTLKATTLEALRSLGEWRMLWFRR